MLRNCGHLERLHLASLGVWVCFFSSPRSSGNPKEQHVTWTEALPGCARHPSPARQLSSWASFSDFSSTLFPPQWPWTSGRPQCIPLFGSQSHKEFWKRIQARIKVLLVQLEDEKSLFQFGLWKSEIQGNKFDLQSNCKKQLKRAEWRCQDVTIFSVCLIPCFDIDLSLFRPPMAVFLSFLSF